MLTTRQEKELKKLNKKSLKQRTFHNDTIMLQQSLNHLPVTENNAPEGMLRRNNQNTYINDKKKFKTKSSKKQNYPPKKLTTPEERQEWVTNKNNQKRAKDNLKPVKPEDQNFGSHDLTGRFIKKVRYGRRTKNPRTPGRDAGLRDTSLVRSEYNDEA
jgi:hypothetical protein